MPAHLLIPTPAKPKAAKPGALVKGSVKIAGHATSISLEPVFWAALRAAATEDARPLSIIITEIDEARTTNLSSAIRVWLFERAVRGNSAVTLSD